MNPKFLPKFTFKLPSLVNNEWVMKEFIITDDDLCFLKKLELLLYQENRLNADNQRDLAQSLTLLIERVKYEKL
jgi:hypothetical protein